jgi:hypothetical protein
MGRASKRKKDQRAARAADARKFRIVVCTYADRSLEPAAELLKAAIIYGDEVLLHSPTALLFASVAGITDLSAGELVEFVRQVAPALGETGEGFTQQMHRLEESVGADGAQAIFQLLLDGSSEMRELIAASDPSAGAKLDGYATKFLELRQELNRAIEEQLASAGVPSVLPAIDAGLLQLAPIENTDDLVAGYVEALWSVLRDARYYPLFDAGIAELVDAAVREGALNLPAGNRSKGKQAGAASGFLARLPTFPRASMDEIIDIRAELDRPLIRFRAEMVRVAHDLGVDAFDPGFDGAAEDAWTSKVSPALLELEELVEEKRLKHQFGVHLPTGGTVGAFGGLVTGIITHAPLIGTGAAFGAAAATTAAAALADAAKLERDMRKRPYYLLHRTEELLAQTAE